LKPTLIILKIETMTALEELVDNLVDEHNVDWYRGVLDIYKRDELFKLRSIGSAPNYSEFVPGEAKALLHPDTLGFVAPDGLIHPLFAIPSVPLPRTRSLPPVPPLNWKAGDGEPRLFVEEFLYKVGFPVLTACRENEKFYSLYMVPKHCSRFMDLVASCPSPPETDDNNMEHSDAAKTFAYNVNGTVVDGKICNLNCNKQEFELVFTSWKTANAVMGWEREDAFDSDEEEDDEDEDEETETEEEEEEEKEKEEEVEEPAPKKPKKRQEKEA
jgi:hypothetical protein